MALKEDFHMWRRYKQEVHSISNQRTFNPWASTFKNFNENTKGCHCERFTCPFSDCKNFQGPPNNRFFGRVISENSNINKRVSDSDSSYYVPSKKRRTQQISSLSENFSNFTLSELDEN